MSWKIELRSLLTLAIPVVVGNLLTVLMNLVDLFFVGQKLGADRLAAAALGNTWFNFYFFGLVGATTMLDTYCSQAFGAQQYSRVGLWAQRGTFLMVILSLPAFVLWGATEPILQYVFHADADLAAESASFIHWLIPGLIPFVLFYCIQRFLIAQDITMPGVYVGIFANLVNVGANFLFIEWFGFVGAPMATSTTRVLQFIALLTYVCVVKPHKKNNTWPGLQWKQIFARDDVEVLQRETAAGAVVAGESDQRQLLQGVAAVDVGAAEQLARKEERAQGTVEAEVKVQASDEAVDITTAVVATAEADVSSPAESDDDSAAGKSVEDKPAVSDEVCVQVAGAESASSTAGMKVGHPLWLMFQLACAGFMMTAFEAWTFEITAMMAAQLGKRALGAHVIMLSLCAFTFLSLPFGVSIAASVRVGQALGAGKAHQARISARLALLLGAGFMTVTGLAMLLARNHVGRIFTSDEDVLEVVAQIAPIAALFQVVDGIQGCGQGIMRGMGRQALVVKIFLVGFWLIGTPLGAILTFPLDVGVRGLWWGLATGLVFVMLILGFMISRVNWKKEAQEAVARVVAQGGAGESGDSTTANAAESYPLTSPDGDAVSGYAGSDAVGSASRSGEESDAELPERTGLKGIEMAPVGLF